jgi:hypothetical protein
VHIPARMSKHLTGPISPSFMTQCEVADFLRVSQRHVANLQRKGLLPCVKLGRRVIYPRDRVIKALDSISTKTTAEVLS